MAEEQPSSQAPSRDEPDGYYISLDYTSSPALADGPSLAWGAPVVDQGEDTGFDEQVYCWGGSSEGEAGVESDGGEEVGYPDDPDEVSEHDALSGPDTLSDHDELSEHDAVSDTNELSDPNAPSPTNTQPPSKTSSASEEPPNTKEQSDADLAFEVACEYLRSLPVSASRGDVGKVEVGDLEIAIASSMAERPRRGSAPIDEDVGTGHQQSEEAAERVGSEIQQRRLARRLKREHNFPVPESSGDASKAEVELGKSAIASSIQVCPQRSPALASAEGQQSKGAAERVESDGQQRRVKTKQDHLSIRSNEDLETRGAVSDLDTRRSSLKAMLAARALKKELERIERIGSKQGDDLIFLRPPKASWIARFAFAPFFEERDPNAKRIRFGLESGQWSIVKPDYIKLAMQFYKKYGVTGWPFGRSSRSGKVIARVWERAQTVNLGQPTMQPFKLLSPQQWPKPVQQPVEPPPWQSFLESMKRPVQQSVDGNARQAIPPPDTEPEKQSIQQAVQQLSRLTVKDAIITSAGKPLQQPVHPPPNESVEDVVQQLIKGPVKTPDRCSIKTQSVKPPETPDRPPAEEPIKKPRFTLLFRGKPVLEQTVEPTEKHSPKSSFRKNPAQRRVERSMRLNGKSGEEAITASSEAACLQQKPQNGLAVSGIIVVCDFQPITPDISPSSPPRTSPTFIPESETVKLKLHSTSPNSPAQEHTLTTSPQPLTLTEAANPCTLFRTLPLEIRTSSSPAQSPIPTASSKPNSQP